MIASAATNRFKAALSYLVMAILLVIVGYPIYWMARSAITPPAALLSRPPVLAPVGFTLQWFREAFVQSDGLTYFSNSLKIACATTLISTMVGGLGAYSLTRFQFPGRNALLFSALISYVFPAVLLFVPIFLILSGLGLVDTKSGIILTHVMSTFPFALWMLRAFFLSIPKELDEAAWVDGAGYLYTFVRIILPLALPGYYSTAIFVFIMSWNEFLFASVIGSSAANKTIPVGIMEFLSGVDQRWGPTMALGVLATVPVVIIFLLLQRYFISGMTAGALKG